MPPVYVQGSLMETNPNDDGLSEDLREKGIREPITTAKYQDALHRLDKLTEDPLTVVDCGANIGYYALMPLAMLPDARVIAVEPHPKSAEVLRQNVALNGYEDRVDVFQCAVGATEEEGTLYQFEEANANSMSEAKNKKYPEMRRGEKIVDVRTLTGILDEAGVSPGAVDVLRMDVEGYEHEVLMGAEEVLTDANRLLINAELHGDLLLAWQIETVVKALLRREYRLVSVAQGCDLHYPKTLVQLFDPTWTEAVIEWGEW